MEILMSEENEFMFLPEYISDDDKDRAYYFINMLIEALPIKHGEKDDVINGVPVKLMYHKSAIKREADFKIYYLDKFYSTKFLHSKIHRYDAVTTNWLVAFILNHKKQIEEFII